MESRPPPSLLGSPRRRGLYRGSKRRRTREAAPAISGRLSRGGLPDDDHLAHCTYHPLGARGERSETMYCWAFTVSKHRCTRPVKPALYDIGRGPLSTEGPPRWTELPVCNVHAGERLRAGRCQSLVAGCGIRCGALMWYQPPYLELCPDHVKVNDLPTYIDQMPPELMSSVFELLFPDTDHSIAGDPSWSTVQDPSWRLDGGDIAAQSILGVSRKWNAIATERMKPLTPEINVTTEEVRMFRGRIRARCDRPDWQLPDLAKSVRLERFGTFDVLIYYTRDEPPLGPASVEDLQFVRLVLHIQMVVAMLRGLPQAVRHLRVNFLVRNVDTGVTADTLLEWAVLLFEPFRGLGNVQQAVVGRVGFLDAANECAVPEAPDQTLTARGRSRLAEYSTEWSGDVQSGVESDTLGWTEAMLQVWMKDARIVNRLRESLKELTPSGATNGTSLDILRRHLSGMRTLQLRCAVACLRKDISGFRRAVLKKELLVDHHRATLELVKKLHHDQTELVLNRQKRLKAAIEELEQQDREGQSEEDALRVTTAANEAL